MLTTMSTTVALLNVAPIPLVLLLQLALVMIFTKPLRVPPVIRTPAVLVRFALVVTKSPLPWELVF